MTTASDLIRGSLRLLGEYPIGSTEEPTTEEYVDLLSELNDLLKSLQTDISLIPDKTQESFPLVSGQQSYTFGIGGDFNTIRPLEVTNGFIRRSNIDYPVTIIGRDKYFDISDKSIQSIPYQMFYDALPTLGKLYLYPTADSADTIFIDSYKPFTGFALKTSTWDGPDEWVTAIKYAFAVIIAPQIPAEIPQIVFQKSIALKDGLSIFNMKLKEMKVDSISNQSRYYNFFRGY